MISLKKYINIKCFTRECFFRLIISIFVMTSTIVNGLFGELSYREFYNQKSGVETNKSFLSGQSVDEILPFLDISTEDLLELKFIGRFVTLVLENNNGFNARSILKSCLRILNQEHLDDIINRLPVWGFERIRVKSINLSSLGITTKQLIVLMPFLQPFLIMNLSGNEIRILPKKICCLRYLTDLDLSGNPLKSFSNGSLDLLNLVYLNLENTDMDFLARKYCSWREIEHLRVYYFN